jgi:hypothetical protein
VTAERAVFALAAERGVTVSAGGGGWFEVLLTAPVGSRFEPGVHELVVAGFPGERVAPVWERALARLSEADAETCDDQECEWCGRGAS